jgi:uncharacterized protein YkwD
MLRANIIILLFCSSPFWNFGQQLLLIDASAISSILKEHNNERQLLKIPDLIWSDELAEYASEWALQLAKDNQGLHHRKSNLYGENIAYWSGSYSYAKGVSLWNEEKKYYKYKANGDDWAKTGHYTQVIWKDTRRVGCGCASGASGQIFFVCNYDPPGNYRGQKPY